MKIWIWKYPISYNVISNEGNMHIEIFQDRFQAEC